jgi:hypothetical protein
VPHDSATVTFTAAGFGDSHSLYLPRDAGPKGLARVLVPQLPRRSPAGEWAAWLVHSHHQPGTRLLAPGQSPALGSAFRFAFHIGPDGRLGRVVADDTSRGLYDGPPSGFEAWADRYEAPDALDGKIVKFYYDGGSEPGDRIVKVSSVRRSDDRLLIKGKDLHKEEHRAYSSDKIRGDILVVG